MAAAARTAYQGQPFFNFQTCVTLGIFLVMAPLVFFGPAIIVREPIKREKRILFEDLERELEQLRVELRKRPPLESEKHQIEYLEDQLSRVKAISLWPYRRRDLWTFVMQLAVALASALIVQGIAFIFKES